MNPVATGNAEKAAESLMKAAKAIAEDDVDSAIKLYLESMSIYEDEEKHIFIGDSWRACTPNPLLFVRQQPETYVFVADAGRSWADDATSVSWDFSSQKETQLRHQVRGVFPLNLLDVLRLLMSDSEMDLEIL
eukprot:758615-Hanusia_phi.AAC.3